MQPKTELTVDMLRLVLMLMQRLVCVCGDKSQ